MRKSKLLMGLYGVYAVYDKISKHYKKLYYASTDEDFIRLYLPEIILDTPLRDLQLFKIAIFNDVTGELKSCVKKRISTDCYMFPHSKLSPVGENLSLDKIEETVNDVKNQIIASNSVEETEENKKEA